MVVATASEDPPHHRVLYCLLGHMDHGNTTAGRRHSTLANKAQVKVWKAGAQCRADIEAKLGVRREKHSKAPVQESQQGEAAHPARMWGRAQTSCSGKQQNRQWWLWKEEGREIPSYRHRAGKAVSCESRRGLDRMSRERVQTKLPPTEKVGEHENVVLIRWGLAYTHRSEQLA